MTLSLSDWLILAAVALALCAAVRSIIRRKKSGRGCCGDCSACAAAGVCRNQSPGDDTQM